VKKHRSGMNDLPLTPLIDTALTLLIIFMIASPMMHNAIKIRLPQGQSKEDHALKHDLVVYIDNNEKLYLNESPTTLQEMLAELSQEALHKTDGAVYVKADKAASYGCVMQVVDSLKVAGGVKYVALATQKQAQS
jgi:biopolymer transport protein ExbD